MRRDFGRFVSDVGGEGTAQIRTIQVAISMAERHNVILLLGGVPIARSAAFLRIASSSIILKSHGLPSFLG
jgi:hypothetical protein